MSACDYSYTWEKLFAAVCSAITSKETVGKRVSDTYLFHLSKLRQTDTDDETWQRIEKFNTRAQRVGPGNNVPAQKLLRELVALLSDVQRLRYSGKA